MKIFALICMMLVMGSVALPAHAQVYPCASPGPGEVVVGQTDAGNGIAPMQLCQRAGNASAPAPMPQAQWESRWGAIATDADKGIIGSVKGMPDESSAKSAALSDCRGKGGAHCILQMPFANGCAALIVGDSVFNVVADKTEQDAGQVGVAQCSKSSANCHVFFSVCSPPERVR